MPFLGLTSLHLVNIQPDSKFHPPYQIFWVRSCSALFFLRFIEGKFAQT